MLVTSQVLDEGIDVPAANVGIILSGSASKRQYAQRLGRILRPTDDRQPARLYEIITEDTMETYVSQRRREGWVPVLTADLARSRTTDETITRCSSIPTRSATNRLLENSSSCSRPISVSRKATSRTRLTS